MSILIKKAMIENEEMESDDFMGDGLKKVPRHKNQTITLTAQDTDRHLEMEVVIKGQVVEQRHRPMMEYERMQYDPEFARLEELCRQLRTKLVDKEREIVSLRSKQGVPVNAAKKDLLLLVGEEFHGSIEHVLEEAGLKLEDVGQADVYRVVTDLEDSEDDEEIPDDAPICYGHQFQEHRGLPMADYGNEWQCPDCGNTKRKR